MPPHREERGWLLDVVLARGEILLWILFSTGERRPLRASFQPRFYLGAPARELSSIHEKIARMGLPCSLSLTEKRELAEPTPRPVLEVTVASPGAFGPVAASIVRAFPGGALYNCDIDLPRLYLYETGLFPLALCRFISSEEGLVREIRAEDSPFDPGWVIPPLRIMEMAVEEERAGAPGAFPGAIRVTVDGEVRILAGEEPHFLLESLATLLDREDPDLLLTDHGDDLIFPRLARLMGKTGLTLPLHRGEGRNAATKNGRATHSTGAWILSGRWHIDRKNSFAYAECGLEGLLEQSRVTRIPVQSLARSSTGTGITSMQIDRALSEGILVPWRKNEPEEFRSALDLLEGDKGGMVFVPRPGLHDTVCELDFASMYPSIMTSFNISPETVDCPCCPENRVPGTGHTLCTRRDGLIPRVLSPLLEKRARYKELRDRASDPEEKRRYEQRQGALKWLLVVSFGYLGYKNARFGKVSAHECVTALGREVLLQAKEVAEKEGYALLHGIVDSLWLTKAGMTEEGCRDLAGKISQKTGISINLEGLYRWLRFFPSKGRPDVAASTCYAGVFRSGKIKVRGLACRRSDTPPFVKRVQEEILARLAQAKCRQEYLAVLPEAAALLDDALRALRDGEVRLPELVITKRLSKRPEDYQKSSLIAIVAQERLSRGILTEPGQKIRYIITARQDPDPASRARSWETFSPDHSCDREAYADLLVRSCAPLIEPPPS